MSDLVMAWWKAHDGIGWDAERAKQAAPGGGPSDFNLFCDLLHLDDPHIIDALAAEATATPAPGRPREPR